MFNLEWLPSLCITVIGILLIGLSTKRAILNSKSSPQKNWQSIYEEEHLAHFIKKREIPQSLFIQIDLKQFPLVDDTNASIYYKNLVSLSQRKMLNLKEYSNLELKKSFGVGQLEILGDYETNFFEFMDISYKYGKILYDLNYIKEAETVLNYLLILGAESSKYYLLLGQIYKLTQNDQELKQLILYLETQIYDSPYLQKTLDEVKTYSTKYSLMKVR